MCRVSVCFLKTRDAIKHSILSTLSVRNTAPPGTSRAAQLAGLRICSHPSTKDWYGMRLWWPSLQRTETA